jgi:hypothetical protein
MRVDQCPRCAAPWEPGYTLCWQCGAGIDGAPPSPGFVPEGIGADGQALPARELACLRCGEPMVLVGRMQFHEGSRMWPFLLGNVGELLVNREHFDSYACRACGKVEFFLTRR